MGTQAQVQVGYKDAIRGGSGSRTGKVGRQVQVIPRAHANASAVSGRDSQGSRDENLRQKRGRSPYASDDEREGSAKEALQQAIDEMERERKEMSFGYRRNLEQHYDVGKVIGEGGFGRVYDVVEKTTGHNFAMKVIPKVWTGDNAEDPERQRKHRRALRNEAEALMRLRGTLNVVHLEGVYEDDENVYLVMQKCRGGELAHRIGERAYTERTVASIMRAVLRTLAQCHAHNIIHRDIKPGNFMLLDSSDESRIKAVDFGLAVPYEDKDLPLGDLGFDGTPWYMAPEMLRSEVVPASDLFAAGVMAFQLLSGRFPFNDRRNPYSPALSLVWRSILTEQPDFTKPYWEDISDEAKDLVAKLLEKDPAKRPTAAEALSHPWLKGDISERHAAGPKPIESTIVQRIQRHSQASAFKRSVLELMAEELLTMHPASKNEAALQTALKTPTMSRKPSMSVFSPGASVHGKASASPGASQHGQQMSLIAYMDLMSKQGKEMANNAVPSPLHPRKVPSNGSSHGRSPGQSRHGGAASMNALASYFARLAASTPTGSNADSRDGTVHSVMGRGQTRPYQGAGGNTPDPTVHAKANPLQIPNHGGPSAASPAEGPQGCAACANGGDGRVGLPLTASVHRALSRLDFHKRSVMRVGSLGDRLRDLGFNMDDNEIEQLLAALDTSNTGHVGRGALLASLIDWNDFSTRCRDQWLSLLRRQFEGLDLNRDGRVSVDDMIETLRGKLSPQELSLAADRIRFESGIVEGSLNEDIDFETFARVMDVGQDYAFRDLDLFDDRVPLTPTSAPDPNVRGGNLFPSLLEPVAEN